MALKFEKYTRDVTRSFYRPVRWRWLNGRLRFWVRFSWHWTVNSALVSQGWPRLPLPPLALFFLGRSFFSWVSCSNKTFLHFITFHDNSLHFSYLRRKIAIPVSPCKRREMSRNVEILNVEILIATWNPAFPVLQLHAPPSAFHSHRFSRHLSQYRWCPSLQFVTPPPTRPCTLRATGTTT